MNLAEHLEIQVVKVVTVSKNEVAAEKSLRDWHLQIGNHLLMGIIN